MADVLHAITVLAIVEAVILNFPAALGDAVEAQAAQPGDREIGPPFSLNQGAVRLMLAIAEHADFGPVEGFPRIEMSIIADLDPVVVLLEHGMGRLAIACG